MLNLIERIFFLLILLLILPIILIISFIIIIVDNQFPFFVQERVGLNGEKFYLFKFKTINVYRLPSANWSDAGRFDDEKFAEANILAACDQFI